MANIQQRRGKGGRWTFRVQVRLRGHPSVTRTFHRRTDARDWAQQTETSIRRGEALATNEARKHTLAELIDRRLELLQRRKPNSVKDQRRILDWWKTELGAYALANITPAVIASKRDKLLTENIGRGAIQRKRAGGTVNRYLAALSKAFSDAQREMHWVSENSVRRVSKEPEARGRVRYLATRERKALLTACRESQLPELELLVMLAMTTGMRRGEILQLRWNDVDLKRGHAVLHKTKNRERRAVRLVRQVVVLLKKRASQKRQDSDLIFGTPDGKQLDPTHWFQKAVEQAKLDDFRFHDLRHTAASYMAMSGATGAEIAAVLGHKTLQMVKRYAHLSDSHTSAVVDRMNKKFFG